jgi:Fe(3+) dicitrate transport protein
MPSNRAVPFAAFAASLVLSLPLQAQQAGEGRQAAGSGESAQMAPVTILGSPEELVRTVGSAHLVDETDLEQFRYDDINRILQEVPGLYIREEDGFGLRPNIGLRGANSDRSQKVTLMEDGVLFGPAPYAAPAAYYFPQVIRMTGVEVFKGPAAIQYGPQTIGGAINLRSAPVPGQREGLLRLAGGTDGFGRLHTRYGGPIDDDWSAQGELVHVRSDGFKELDGGGDTGFDQSEALVKLGRRIGQGQVELRLGYANETSDETYLGLTEKDFRANPDRRYLASALDEMNWDWYGVRADFEHPLWGGEARLTAYSHDFERAWRKFNTVRDTDIRNILRNPDTPRNRQRLQVVRGDIESNPDFAGDDLLIGTNDRSFRSSGIQARFSRDFGRHRLTTGFRLHSDRIRRLHDEASFDVAEGQLVRNDVPLAITADNTGRATALALYARDEIRWGRLTLAPGLRVEGIRTELDNRLVGRDNSENFLVVLPGVGLHFAQTETLSWLAGVHRGFSPPSPSLDSGVEEEDAVNGEAGLRWLSPVGRIEAIGFYSRYSNLTAQCTFSAGCEDADIGEQTNAGRVRVFGLETSFAKRLPVGRALFVPLEASYTFTRGEFREAFESANPQFGDVEPGFELPYVPEHRFNVQAGLGGPRWEVVASAQYQSEMRDTAGRGPIPAASGTDSYTVVDLAGRFDLTAALALTARVDNLLDRDYVVARRPFGARPGRPLSLQAGVDYRF